jgi:hypothetical protein
MQIKLGAAAIEHDLYKPAQLRREVLFGHSETPIAVFNRVDEPIRSRSSGRNVLHADTHEQMSDLRSLRIGIEIQLTYLLGARKATTAAHGDGRRLVARSRGLANARPACLVCGKVDACGE